MQLANHPRGEIERIQDFYDKQIDVIRDNTDKQLKELSRSDRDRLQSIRDHMDDEKETELNGLNDRFEAAKRAEEQRSKEAIAAAKAAAEQLSKEVGETLAKRLQTDAIGTITDVFERIRALPAEQRLSVVSDLFGDEARALLPLINNTDLLASTLAKVARESDYAKSSQEEYFNRLGAASSQLQLAKNNLDVLSIAFGEQFVPALIKVVEGLNPVIEGLTWMIDNIPGFGPALAILAGGFVALVAVLPALGSLVFLLQTMGGLSAIFASITGALGALGSVLLGIFTGPVGWAALLVAAGVAIYAFRDQIGDVFNAIGGILQAGAAVFKSMYIDPVVAAFTPLAEFINTSFVQPMQAALTLLGQILQKVAANIKIMFIDPVVAGFTAVVEFVNSNVVQPISDAFKGLVQGIGDTFRNVTQAITAPFEAAFQTVRGIVNNILNGIGNAVRGVVQAINNVIAGANQALARLKLPQIPFLPQPNIPQFAEGGVVTGPTLAMVGEGGEPEYIVPQSKASGFAANWMDGKRGAAAIPGFANGGMVMPSSATLRSAESSGMMSSNAQISIQTGPVMQMNGQNFVTTQDLSRAVQSGVQQTLNMMRNDRGTRRAVGLT